MCSVWMAVVTSVAVVCVALHSLVMPIGSGLIAVRVASEAIEHREITLGGMTVRASIPTTLVRATEDREVLLIVVEGRWRPTGCGMAERAVRGIDMRKMRWRRARIVVGHVAGFAIGRRSGITIRVALRTADVQVQTR